MSSTALVLGGGGTVGIAWEVGVLKGLRDAGIDLGAVDRIIGTSAGSVVGTQLALGRSVDDMLAEQLAPTDGSVEAAMRFDPQTFMAIAARWGALREMTEADRAAIGALALQAPTVEESLWLRVFEATLNGAPWPERLVVTGVDAASGAFKAWDHSSHVPLVRAVAASCTVPGLFPPVTIEGRRCVDGGVRSGTNADLAVGYGTVLVIAPIGPESAGSGQLAGRQMDAEIAGLRDAGSAVDLLLPTPAALTAFGPNLMDVTRRAVAAEIGVQQGMAEAEQLRQRWARGA